MSQDLLITLVPYFVPVIIIFATSIAAAAYQQLLRWLPPNQRDMLEYAVSRAVHAVEQVIPGEASAVKKHEAEIRVAEILQTFHVSMPAEAIDSSIEAAVHALNMAGNQATGKVPTVASRFIEDSPQVKASKQRQNITAQNER